LANIPAKFVPQFGSVSFVKMSQSIICIAKNAPMSFGIQEMDAKKEVTEK
jgi:hypothetical protein